MLQRHISVDVSIVLVVLVVLLLIFDTIFNLHNISYFVYVNNQQYYSVPCMLPTDITGDDKSVVMFYFAVCSWSDDNDSNFANVTTTSSIFYWR